MIIVKALYPAAAPQIEGSIIGLLRAPGARALAVQVHSVALKNPSRKKALRRLYNSLRLMTFVCGAILMLFVVFTLT